MKLFNLLLASALTLPLAQTANSSQQLVKTVSAGSSQPKQAGPSPNQSNFTQGSLEEGDQVFSETNRRFDAYSFDGQTSETIHITVTSEAFNPVVYLIHEATDEMVKRQTGESGTVSLIQRLPQNGSYVILVSAAATLGEGNYQVRIAGVQELNQSEAEAYRLSAQGSHQAQRGELEAAIQSYEQALVLYREMDDHDSQRIILSNLVLAWGELLNRYVAVNEYQQAIDAAESVMVIAGKLGDRTIESSVLGTLGFIHEELEDYERAIELHQQALEIALELEDKTLQARALNNLGVTFKAQGDYPRAINAYEQSLTLAQEAEDLERQINALGNLANAHKLSGNYQIAISYYEQFLAFTQETENLERQLNALSNLANIHQLLENHQQATSYYEQAIVVAKKVDDWSNSTLENELMNLYLGLGEVNISQGDYRQSVYFFEESLSLLAPRLEVDGEPQADARFCRALNGLGIANRNLGNYQQAISSFEKCLRVSQQTGDSGSEGTALGNLGTIHGTLGNPQKAIEYFQQALELLDDNQDRLKQGQILRNLGASHIQLGNHQQAEYFLLARPRNCS
ncbi:MAG: tetratricopeptide repeat protein [Leptolyngbya sp. SIOISBB]|nr:tetratricopeptide repeat protein [Leptolyngbya sp. SIOISBB]